MDFKPPKRFSTGTTGGHRHWRKQESALATETGGKLTPGSGSGRTVGDVRVKGWSRLEAKSTDKQSFSVTRAMVQKVDMAALQSGEVLPAITLDFVDTVGGVTNVSHSVCIVPRYALEMLLGVAKEQA